MKLLVLGGTGGTGRHVVEQALDGGHDVIVLARDPAKVAAQHARLRVVRGDVMDAGALTDATRSQDAVISAIGRGLSFKSEHLIARSVPSIINAMTATGVRRLVFTSALGVGPSIEDAPLPMKLFCRTLLRGIYADKLVGDTSIRNSGVDWTIVQPAKLTDGPLTKNYRSGERLALKGMPAISRADTAHFLLGSLTDPATIRRTLVIAD